MVALPSGKQRSIHGPAVNVPSKVDTICDVLPRLPSQSELVPLKLKRKVAFNVKVQQVHEPVTVNTGKKKQDVTVADASATGRVTLWEEHVGKLQYSSRRT